MKKIYVFLADGFEEIEGLTVVDLLRRAGLDVVTVSIKEEKRIMGGQQIPVEADTVFSQEDFSQGDMLVLPGGGVGTDNLEAFQPLMDLVKAYAAQEKKVAAICAAPRILAGLGLLADKTEESVAVDGCFITSRGLGTAIDFSLELIAQLLGKEKAKEIAASVVCTSAAWA